MPNVATRLLSLILMLQSRPSWKAAELADELNVSERTVHRYMGMIEEMGIPIYSERGPYGGFSLLRGYKLPPLIFTAEEATVLYMGANLVRETWGQTYRDAVTAVTAKLDNVLPDELRQEVARAQRSLVVAGWTSRDYAPWQATIHSLRQCIVEGRCTRLVYRGLARRLETERVVEPYALTLQWGTWYLVGYCRLRMDLRTFRVDRIQEVAPVDDCFAVPRDFDLQEYIDRTMRLELPYSVRVQLAPSCSADVKEAHSHWMEFTDHADGSVTAQFSVADFGWVSGWVLSYGAAAKVLEPPDLIDRVRAAAEGALQRYRVRAATE
jgi:predicted DNA-binding transcriptional regulator YafY